MDARQVLARRSKGPAKIGQILLKHTSLTEDQLTSALKLQKEEGKLLGQILVEKKFVMPHEIMRALCLQLGIPFLDELQPDEVDPDLVTGIPINYAKTKGIIPIQKRGEDDDPNQIYVVAVADPFNPNTLDDFTVLKGKRIEWVVATDAKIQDAINKIYEKNTSNLVDEIEGEFDDTFDLEGPIDILEASEDDAPVIKFVHSLLFRAVKDKASDIHIEPYEKDFVVRFRIDGVLQDIIRQQKRAHAAITSRIKVMGVLDIAEKRMPQDGRIKIKIAGKDIDIRLSTIPTIFGERIVMRILEQSGTILELEHLGFPPRTQDIVEHLISLKHGIILVTGPTGSGKSTTLSAFLSKMNSPDLNILTVEDPIEYQIPGINQVQVNTKIELTFSRALRHFLRQDPDIIMVGEIRDKETAEIAINASLTGHLVLSTIHTNDAAGAPPRLMDMGVEPFLVASSLAGIIAQRLMRKVCQKCREEYVPSDYELQEFRIKKIPDGVTVYQARGCPSCNKGYSGRTVIQEILLMNEDLRRHIVENAPADTIRKTAIKSGMIPLRQDGVEKVLNGITTFEELGRVTHAGEGVE